MTSRDLRGRLAVASVGALLLSIQPAGLAGAAVAPIQPLTSAVLRTLPVKGRAPMTGYSRAAYGQAWADVDRNGCDTRNDVLRRDLKPHELKAGTRGCLVLKGTLLDPYTRKTIAFVRGAATSNAVQIDHVVAIGDSWQKGAQQWTIAKRTAFANDSLNLLAVDGPSNLRKGAGDAATWLPPNRAFRCLYVSRQVAVKKKYGLWVTVAERDAISRVLATCPTQRVPIAKAFVLGVETLPPVVVASPTPPPVVPTATIAPIAAPAPEPVSTPTPAPDPAPTPAPAEPYYANCDAVRAAGAAPIYRGQPGYRPALDRDNDGIGCE